MNLTPRLKIIIASSLLLALGLATALRGADLATTARVLLGLAAAVGLASWAVRARRGSVQFRNAPRLVVVQRVGLSARSGLALIEVDGRAFIVVHGDGFARVRPAPRRTRVPTSNAPLLNEQAAQ